LSGLLRILLLSRIAGCRGWDATADWAAAHDDLFCRHLALWKTPPGADTLRRTAQAYALEDVLEAIVAEGETVHIDGKRLRGAGRDGTVHHLVEAWCGGRVIGLAETGAGAEGPAIQELVADLELAGRRVTIAAAGTTPAVAAAVRGRGADFLLAVEPDQPALPAAMRQAFDQTAGPAPTTKDRGHGRHETRRARTLTDPQIVARVSAAARIAGIRGLCRSERTRVTQDGIVPTVHCHISSRPLTPRQHARGTRSHWSVEAMHHVLDVALDEDACRIGIAAATMGALRRLAYRIIAELRGPLSFRRFAERRRANPARLLEICAACR